MIFRKRTKPTHVTTLDEIDELAAEGRPVLIDFFQVNCRSCSIMSGIVNELAHEYRDSAHVVKADIGRVPGATEKYRIQSTPTFVLLARPTKQPSKKARKRAGAGPASPPSQPSPRWRAAGLIKKDDLERALRANGAEPSE